MSWLRRPLSPGLDDVPLGVDDPIDTLIGRLLEAAESGDTDTDVALEELCSAHPDHAPTLRRRAQLLTDLGVLTPPIAREDSAGNALPVDADDVLLPQSVGPYRLLRPLGAGGMGVVHLAEQLGMDRLAAVKLIRPEQLLFARARERFRREVETVARLQHPAIVPIYTVGEDAGLPWFAMEYVRGASLADVLDDLRERGPDAVHLTGRHLAEAVSRCSPADAEHPTDPEDAWLFAGSWEAACLRVVGRVADALEHAHRRGVVHRDLKPGNVMLAHDDTGGQVKLLDFGLARRNDGGSVDQSLTRAGSRLGSLPYMAPEQTRAEGGVDARTDVYALGVLLYELLTLKRPFDQTTETALVAAIERGTARRVRALNPAVSWEAETVCLAAMDPDPDLRYASAADAARDLAAAEQHRPLEARRLGLLPRARRWIERNPLAATTCLLTLVLVVGVPLAFYLRERETSAEIRRQLARADAHFGRSLAAIDAMLTRVGAEDLRDVPQVEPLRVALLEDAVALTEATLSDEADDPLAMRRAAGSNERLGRLLLQLGRSDEGFAALDRSLALHDRLIAEAADPILERGARADVLVSLAEGLERTGDLAGSEAAHREADAVLAVVTAAHPELTAPVLTRGRNLTRLGHVLNRRLEPEAPTHQAPGLAVWEQASVLMEAALSAAPDDAHAHADLGELRTAMAQLLLRPPAPVTPRPRELALVDAADGVLERAVALAPDNPSIAFRALVARLVRAKAVKAEGRFADSEQIVHDALPGLRRLARDFPSTPAYHIELATALNEIGVLYDYRRMPPQAADWYGQGVTELRVLAERFPTLADLQSRAGQGEMNVGVSRMNLGELHLALDHFERAVVLQTRAVELAPDDPAIPYRLRYHHMARGNVLLAMGRLADAADAADALAASIPDDWESHTQAAAQLAKVLDRLMNATTPDAGDDLEADLVARAVEHLRQAIELGFPAPGELATAQVLAPLRGRAPFEALVTEVIGG